MRANELRQAAETLRNRAAAATPGPWVAEQCEDELSVRAGTALTSWRTAPDGTRLGYPPSSYATTDVLIEHELEEWGENPENSTEAQRIADADYIATVHPRVGLALAEWLLIQSHHVASHDCAAHCEPDGCDETNQALVLARLINGGE